MNRTTAISSPRNLDVVIQPKTQAQRPQLPVQNSNPQMQHLDPKDLPPVKFQKIARPEKEILVGRVKIPTPTSHAFILRRFDTGAISLTTMFRAAFPDASEDAERAEMAWIKANYDLSGANGGAHKDTQRVRFAGTWGSPQLAVTLSESYGLRAIIKSLALAEAEVPLPAPVSAGTGNAVGAGRTPEKAANAAGIATRQSVAANKQLPTPSPTNNAPPPAKRRKEASPAPEPPVRRSTRHRTQSPAPATSTRARTPRRRQAQHSSDETAVEPDAEETEALAKPSMLEDIAEQHELIADLKAKRQAELGNGAPIGGKRAREEEVRFNFQDPASQDEVAERAIATNRRVTGFAAMEPRNKQVAWGALAFAAGVGLASYLPSFLF